MKIYCGTYKAYNEGSLKGEWFDLEDYDSKEEFLEACTEFHKDEDDPEFMFQDWEDIPDSLIGESWVSEKVWDLLKAYEDHDEDAVKAYVECFGEWDEEGFQDRYRGKWSTWEEMAEELLEETGELSEIPERLQGYFDYEKYARDIRLGGDMVECDNHFFWNH